MSVLGVNCTISVRQMSTLKQTISPLIQTPSKYKLTFNLRKFDIEIEEFYETNNIVVLKHDLLAIECTNNIISKHDKKRVFEHLIHKFQHVRQGNMAYNVDPVRYVKSTSIYYIHN